MRNRTSRATEIEAQQNPQADHLASWREMAGSNYQTDPNSPNKWHVILVINAVLDILACTAKWTNTVIHRKPPLALKQENKNLKPQAWKNANKWKPSVHCYNVLTCAYCLVFWSSDSCLPKKITNVQMYGYRSWQTGTWDLQWALRNLLLLFNYV